GGVETQIVPLDAIPRGRRNVHAVHFAADHISGPRRAAANEVVRSAVEDDHAVAAVAGVAVRQSGRARGVDADIVPGDDVAVRAGVRDQAALLVMAADYVAGPGGGAADGVVDRAGVDLHADAVGQRPGPRRVGADQVAGDDHASSLQAAAEEYADGRISRNL